MAAITFVVGGLYDFAYIVLLGVRDDWIDRVMIIQGLVIAGGLGLRFLDRSGWVHGPVLRSLLLWAGIAALAIAFLWTVLGLGWTRPG